MKLWRIVWVDGICHALAGNPEHAIGAAEDRESLTDIARRLAGQHDGVVHVLDATGKLEIVFAYIGGAEHVRYVRRSLRMVRSEGRSRP